MKKYVFLKQIFLLTFTIFTNFNSTNASPKKRSYNEFSDPTPVSTEKLGAQLDKLFLLMPQSTDENKIKQIESYFDINKIDKLLNKIANRSKSEQPSCISLLMECSQLFSSKQLICQLDRNRSPQYRNFFEDKIIEEFEKHLLTNLVKDNELFLNFTSFACGYLFQDFVILNKIIRLIKNKYPQIIRVNLNLRLIDPITNKDNKGFKIFTLALAQLVNYLRSKSININIYTKLFSNVLEYFEQCDLDPNKKSDIITCVDYEYKVRQESMAIDGFKFLILNCLKKKGIFFLLDKNGTLRNNDQIINTGKKNFLTEKEIQKILSKHSIHPIETVITKYLYINGEKKTHNPIIFYGTIDPEKFLLNEINAIHLDTGKTFNPFLSELMVK